MFGGLSLKIDGLRQMLGGLKEKFGLRQMLDGLRDIFSGLAKTLLD